MKRSRGFTLIELMIVIAIIAIIAAIAIPGILGATRAANERNASGSLRQFGSIQVTYKSADSDQNLIADYWTADVKGLYFIAAGTPTPSPIRLIEISVAAADARMNPDAGYSASNPAATVLPSSPKSGYWYTHLTNYEEPKGTTNNAYGARNTDRFGYLAFPNAYGSSGRLVFIVNEGGTMFKKDPGSSSAVVTTLPASGVDDTDGTITAAYDVFPMDPFDPTNGSGAWSKMD